MTPGQANLITRAVDLLDHIEGRRKCDVRGLEMLRGLLRAVQTDGAPPLEPLPLPSGCAEGRDNVRRGDWVR